MPLWSLEGCFVWRFYLKFWKQVDGFISRGMSQNQYIYFILYSFTLSNFSETFQQAETLLEFPCSDRRYIFKSVLRLCRAISCLEFFLRSLYREMCEYLRHYWTLVHPTPRRNFLNHPISSGNETNLFRNYCRHLTMWNVKYELYDGLMGLNIHLLI